LVLHEGLSVRIVAGMAVVLAGTALSRRKRRGGGAPPQAVLAAGTAAAACAQTSLRSDAHRDSS
ncbi:MAG: hypothetical protein ACRDRL_17230, partial [Sciscionella sp.]